MASPAAESQHSEPTAPVADPMAIRAGLSSTLAAMFDSEWDAVLENAKRSKDLDPVHDFLTKWRHIAYAERKEPGSHFALLAKAERILHTGDNPDALPIEDVRALIAERLGR